MASIPAEHPAVLAVAVALARRCMQNKDCDRSRHVGEAIDAIKALNTAGYVVVKVGGPAVLTELSEA